MRMFPSGSHLTAVTTESMRIKHLAQGHCILMQPGLEPSIVATRNRHLNDMSNMLQKNNKIKPIIATYPVRYHVLGNVHCANCICVHIESRIPTHVDAIVKKAK